MTRVLEIIIAIAIVAVLAVLVGLFLPSHGHIERSVEINHPIRHIHDVVAGLKRYQDYSALRLYDPAVTFSLEGAERGVGNRLRWNGNERIGSGSVEITEEVVDSKVVMKIEDESYGSNKTYTFELEPDADGKKVELSWAYDVDFGWNLMARYSGLYLDADPASRITLGLGQIAAMVATFPKADYSETEITTVEQVAKPVLFLQTKAKRSIADVETSTVAATTSIMAVVRSGGLQQTGPRQIVTRMWGDENYEFNVLIPVDRTDVPLSGEVKAGMSYGGKALQAIYIGHAAGLPLARDMLRAYSMSHGEAIAGNYYDEVISDPATTLPENQVTHVYLPIQ